MRSPVGIVLIAAGVTVLAAMVVAAPAMHDRATLDVDASVDDVTVQDGNVSVVSVRLTNTGDRPVQPVFHVWSKSWDIQNAWEFTGPRTLSAGESAVYKLHAPGERVTPDAGGRFLVRITDSGRQSWATLGPFEVPANAST